MTAEHSGDDLFLELMNDAKSVEQEEAFYRQNIAESKFDLNRWMTAFKGLIPLVRAAAATVDTSNPNYQLSLNSAILGYIQAATALNKHLMTEIAEADVNIDDWVNRWSVRKIFAISASIVEVYLESSPVINQTELNRLGSVILTMAMGVPSASLLRESSANEGFLRRVSRLLDAHPELQGVFDDDWQNTDLKQDLLSGYGSAFIRLVTPLTQKKIDITPELTKRMSEVIEGSVVAIIQSATKDDMIASQDTCRMLFLSAFDKASSLLVSAIEHQYGRLSTDEQCGLSVKENSEQFIDASIGYFEVLITSYIVACERARQFIDALLTKDTLGLRVGYN